MTVTRPLDQIETWVFDLDNTLYPATSSLFPQIDVRMRRFISERFHMPLDEAFALQKRYYREFGTTLRGLMLVHGLEPSAFLDYVHDIDHSVLAAAPDLDRALAALPGRKLIFTNGSERHAEKVLAQLGIGQHFSGIFDIEAARYVPKPQPECYLDMVARFAFDPRAAAMVEDIHRNLKPAFDIGMTTVWVRQDDHPDAKVVMQDDSDLAHVDHVVDDLVAWLRPLPTRGGQG
ncbi:MAG: pyrimidine 5'-nucleotidase [Alphaproteobacteria bacterium]|nr:pyrimidine 5'-nucleotidase [Alphaproteobacteria bacterium]